MGVIIPRGNPRSSIPYWPSCPKTLIGPIVPQSTAAVKNVLGPGQVNLIGASGVQTSLMLIYNFR